MADRAIERRLAAVLAADVVGYSRLMEADEDGTIAAWHAARSDIIDPTLADHDGRIVKHTGDGFLAEFSTVTSAVRCALAMQDSLADHTLEFRMGVNLGDIVADGEDIHGDGVNIAARLESLAPAGGICVSGGVYDQIRKRIGVEFEDLGERTVKNISTPVRVWQWPRSGIESIVDVSKPVPGFGGRPAIAVLPFDNLSGDPDQEYFADGIVEDVITKISLWGWLPVIARNSTFKYKGQPVDIREIGARLGAGYVLEGSVRKADDRVRVTGQLIDVETEQHLWAERYDRKMVDIFDLQDEIADAVVGAVESVVGRAERTRAHQKIPGNLDAWNLYQRAMWHFWKQTREDLKRASDLFQQATEKDPSFAIPPARISNVRLLEVLFGWSDNPAATLKEARDFARRATALDPNNPVAHQMTGIVSVHMREYDEGIESELKAVALNPSDPMGHYLLGIAYMADSQHDFATESIERAIRISPNDEYMFLWTSGLSAANYMARNYEKARDAARICVRLLPQFPLGYRNLAASCAQLGDLDAARNALRELLKLSPNFSRENARHSVPMRNEADFEHFMEGLEKAGLQP